MAKRYDPNILGAFMPIRSSILTKVSLNSRMQLNRAIVYRESPTYQELYLDFGLAELGVSFTAFYYYARQIRTASALAELARLPVPADQTVHDLLPSALGHALLDAALDPASPPQTIERLSRAYRMSIASGIARKRLEFDEADHKKCAPQNEITDIPEMAARVDKLKPAAAVTSASEAAADE